MAIGAVVSNRHFGSFSVSGRVCQGKKPSTVYLGLQCGFAAPQYIERTILYNKLYLSRIGCSSPRLHSIGFLNGKPFRSNPSLRVEANECNKFSKECHTINSRRQFRRCKNHLSFGRRIQPRMLDYPSIIDGQSRKRKHATVNRTKVDYRSEDYEITGELDSLVLPEGEAAVVEGTKQDKPWWQGFPRRWVIVLLCFASFLLCNMDRVNMSIAILPMSKQFNWNSATVGLIQSSFFWGYLLTQIVGGIWADKLGGKIVLGFGVVWWSLATVLTPIAANIGLPFLLIMRAFMGIGEGVAMPAMNNLLSKWIPVSERSRSLALVYSGMYLGSVTGLAVSPILINKFGWPSVFYSFGSLGSIWFALWWSKAHSSPNEDPMLTAAEKRLIMAGSTSKEPVSTIPWKLILSKAPVWALIISHFCHNWGTFILLTWMPTYYNQVLKFNLTESGLFCVLPWLTMAIFANIGGWIADTLVSKGLSITSVRKIMQSIGFLGPAFFLTQLSKVNTPALAVMCMACSQGSDAFSQSGLYSNHQDIGPRYAGVLLGLSNTAGVLAGVFGTVATGYILQKGSWDDVFKVAVALYIIGTLVWNLFSTGERILD